MPRRCQAGAVRQINPAAKSFLGPNRQTSLPKNRLTTAVVIYRQLSQWKTGFGEGQVLGHGSHKQALGELQKPRDVSTDKKQTAKITQA